MIAATFERMELLRRALIVALTLCSSGQAADDWQLFRFEGRDYVPLDNVARFYGFPPPPVLQIPSSQPAASNSAPSQATPADAKTDDQDHGSTSTAANAATAIANASTEGPKPIGGHVIADSSIVPGTGAADLLKTVALDSGKAQLKVIANSREAWINGAKQWLSFPTIVQDGKLLISRLDLSKTLEPRLRPEKVQGLKPVRTVVLDAGHGGHDKGATSRFGYEKDFSLDVALRLKEKLERRGMKVLMTRTSDVFIPLHERPRVANNTEDAIFVSIHFNSATSNPLAKGFEIYSIAPRGAPATNDGAFSIRHLREEPGNVVDTQSAALAGSIFHAMLGYVPMEDRGLKQARFAVLRLCTKPSVLIELGFLSNSPESAQIGTPAWRQKVADSIATGIESYKELAEERHIPKVVAQYRQANTTTDEAAASTVPPAAAEALPQSN
jgi:N-acetylmuramoyl-L-alanine amidase